MAINLQIINDCAGIAPGLPTTVDVNFAFSLYILLFRLLRSFRWPQRPRLNFHVEACTLPAGLGNTSISFTDSDCSERNRLELLTQCHVY